jgi:HlyD family secretion protein
MNRRLCHCLFVVGVGVWIAAWACSSASAQSEAAKPAAPEAKPDVAPAKAETPPTHTVKKGLVKSTLDLDGVFEAQNASEIALRLEEWTAAPLIVESVVKHGTRIKKGETLVKFDTAKLDKAIDDLRAELKLGELGQRQAELALQAEERTTPMDLAANERAARILAEDQRYFFDVQRPYDLKAIEQQLKSAKNSLEYQEEELRQLEKMYKADDITEETEEIVLKRQRDQVEAARLYFESAQMRHDFALKYSVPREDERTRETGQRSQIETEKAKITLPLALQKQRLEMDKLRVQRQRSEERLKGLLADRELLTVRAPAEGIVYYGKATRGKFGDAQTVAETLRPRGTVQLNQVFMTIVPSQPLAIRTTVAEDQLHRVRAGLPGVAVPNSQPELKLPAVITRISDVPLGPGSFDAQLKVTLDKDNKTVVPGMACKVKLVPYLKKDAVTIPPKALMTEELDDQPFVYLLAKDGKAAKRPVTVGQKTDKVIEILAGLAEGDQVLLEAPK